MVKAPSEVVNFGDYAKMEETLLKRLAKYKIEIADPMIFFCNRMATFSKWAFKNGSCTAEFMAYAGYYVVQDDCAKCIFCIKELDGWEVTDDPWEEHKSHKPDCPLVKLNKRNITTMTLQEFAMLNQVVHKNLAVETLRQGTEVLVQVIDNHKTSLMAKLK